MRMGIISFLMVVLVACSSGGTTTGFCRRYLTFFDDLAAGNVPTFQEFQARIDPQALGDPGGFVGDSYDRLLLAVQTGDEEGAVSESFYLEELCFDVVNG